MRLKAFLYLGIFVLSAIHCMNAQPSSIILRPAAVFDGQELHTGWSVVVTGDKITAAGPSDKISAPAGARTIDLPNETLLPGMIEGHSHLFLHPYNETSWNDQVTNESFALRSARNGTCATHFDGGIHDDARSRNRGRRLRRCRNQTGNRAGNHSRSANDRGHARNRRARKLRSEVISRTRFAPGRAGSERHR